MNKYAIWPQSAGSPLPHQCTLQKACYYSNASMAYYLCAAGCLLRRAGLPRHWRGIMPSCLLAMQTCNAAANCCCSQGKTLFVHVWSEINGTKHSCKGHQEDWATPTMPAVPGSAWRQSEYNCCIPSRTLQ